MSTPVKFAAAAAIIGVLVFFARSINQWAKKITIAFQSIGIPAFRNGRMALPVTLKVSNLTPLSIPINNIQAALFIMRNGAWHLLGQTENTGPVNINPGDNPLTIYPAIDLAMLTPQNVTVLTLLNTLANYNPIATVRIVAKVNVQGYEFEETTDHKIMYNQLYQNAG